MTSINQSAGILVYRFINEQLEFLLVHPGGPYNYHKDLGIWTIPKGGIEHGETVETAARREFFEETNLGITQVLNKLTSVTNKSGKLIHAFAVNENIDLTGFKSNEFEFKGLMYPEVDRIAWFEKSTALAKIHPSQAPFITEIIAKLL